MTQGRNAACSIQAQPPKDAKGRIKKVELGKIVTTNTVQDYAKKLDNR